MMEQRSRILYIAAAAAVAGGIVLLIVFGARRNSAPVSPAAVQQEESGIPPVATGDRAADFSLESLNGRKVSLSNLRGKVVFLNIWATWCPPCREEMPSMETLYDEFKNNKDFVMLAVSQDTESAGKVATFVRKNGYHFTILLDPDNKVGEAYDVSGVPETFIIDRKGRIVAHHMGAFDWSRPDVKEALQELLDSKAG
jgi:peroxiredoxin